VSQLSGGSFSPDSDCVKIINTARHGRGCFESEEGIGVGPFWKIVPGSCKDGKNFKIAPALTLSEMSCEEDLTKLTEAEQKQIQDKNSESLQWIDENTVTYSSLSKNDVCATYEGDTGRSTGSVLTLPSGFTSSSTYDFVTGKFLIKIEKVVAATTGPAPRPVPKKGNAAYYVCPYNDIKTQQSRIYKRVDSPTLTGLSGLGTNQDCLADVPGFLQRIEIWQQRLWDFQYADTSHNLFLSSDENRFTLLDTLNVSRSRLNQCVQGFGQAYKEAATSTYLFTCEQGITAQKLGSLLILPEFPPHNSVLDTPDILPNPDTTWNCYPFNSSRLNASQKTDCFNNKDKGSECQAYIKNYMNDFYCCQGK
jgi:hypothetical protein